MYYLIKRKPTQFENIFNRSNISLLKSLVPNLDSILKTINDGVQYNHILPKNGKYSMIRLLFDKHSDQIGFNNHRYLT